MNEHDNDKDRRLPEKITISESDILNGLNGVLSTSVQHAIPECYSWTEWRAGMGQIELRLRDEYRDYPYPRHEVMDARSVAHDHITDIYGPLIDAASMVDNDTGVGQAAVEAGTLIAGITRVLGDYIADELRKPVPAERERRDAIAAKTVLTEMILKLRAVKKRIHETLQNPLDAESVSYTDTLKLGQEE